MEKDVAPKDGNKAVEAKQVVPTGGLSSLPEPRKTVQEDPVCLRDISRLGRRENPDRVETILQELVSAEDMEAEFDDLDRFQEVFRRAGREAFDQIKDTRFNI
jgi:hypothetical protein